MAGETLANIRKVRIEKAQKLKELGIDPYPSKSNRDTYTKEIIENYDEQEGSEVIVSGRLMSWREHGQLVFADIQDNSGKIQLYIRSDEMSKLDKQNQTLGFDQLNLIDVGDIAQAKGIVTKTKRGEISIQVNEFKILTKSIRPLPDKWDGLKDKEALFRQRYLDTILNPEKRKPFRDAAKITFAIREFLNNRGFLEIQTPILQPIYGGGTAKPFTTRVNALDVDFYLAIAHELYLKRLITAGFDNVYNISGYFRNEGIDRTHNPQFNMLETMTAYQNYEFNMDLIEEMYKYIGMKVFDKSVFKIQGQDVDFGKEWERIKMIDAVKKYANIDFDQVKNLDQAHKILDEIGFKDEKARTIGEVMVQVFEEKVEEQLIQPTFIYGHPVEISPLSKTMSNDSRFVERFEIFIGGIEGGDNWTELNDPIELYERFKDQVDRGRAGQDEFHPMDVDFLETMEYGMPPTTGLGPGIERLQMMFTETEYIDDVLFFPMMKPAPVTDIQKEIYGKEYVSGEKVTNHNSEQDFSKSIIIVVSKELEGWQLENTVGHIAGSLGAQIGYSQYNFVDHFETKDNIKIQANSQYGIIVKVANPGQMKNLLEKVQEGKFKYLAYTQDMIDSGNDEELKKIIGSKSLEELQINGIGVFGDKDDLKKLTNKFSLIK